MVKFKNDGTLTQEDLEKRTPKPMLELFNILNPIMIESGIVEHPREKIKLVL